MRFVIAAGNYRGDRVDGLEESSRDVRAPVMAGFGNIGFKKWPRGGNQSLLNQLVNDFLISECPAGDNRAQATGRGAGC